MNSTPRGKIAVKNVHISDWQITSDNISKLQFEKNGHIYYFPSSDAMIYNTPLFDPNSNVTILDNESYYFEQQDLVHFVLNIELKLHGTEKLTAINFPLPYTALHTTLGHMEVVNAENTSERSNLGLCTINDSLTHAVLKSDLFNPNYMSKINIQTMLIYKRNI
jgi:hypothetical protein